MRKPIIGILANFHDREPGREQVRLNVGYLDGVQRAGGLAVVLPPTDDPADMERMLDAVDGLLFGGGYDVSPARYGQALAHSSVTALAARLEPFIFALLERADRRADLPVFGICLGQQVFNVARGGTLHQHLPEVPRPNSLAHRDEDRPGAGRRAYHTVAVEPGTLLARLVGDNSVEVNSGHHQAADRLGRDLKVSARSADNVVEAVEDPSRPFFLAVQWHPEELLDRPEHLALFGGLVEAAGRKGQ